ncbi:hypothetical protein [Reyranella soli]|nr:hypothetical protein [Reyranella soli]
MAKPFDNSVQEKRDLAQRSTRLGRAQPNDADKALLYQYADELERAAAEFEGNADRQPVPSTSSPRPVIQQQQQQQPQEQGTEPPTAPKEPKDPR